jgi:hypothetical protein
MDKIMDHLYTIAFVLGFASGLLLQLIVTGNGF